ncbi:MAG: hypothetical protein PVF37_20235 [Desulfobacterales bacterium]|jgi:hypothetical protein
MLNIDDISRQVLYNCNISDANHAGMFSICGLALRLRDLYKWEKGLSAWEESDSAEVLGWIETKENQWESYPENGFERLDIDGITFDPFDTIGINKVLEKHDILYGAGYARSLKPTFFMAVIAEKASLDGTTIYTLGSELARDLLTIPALTQDNCVLLRQESAKLFIWDSIVYIKKSARPALKFALDSCGLKNHEPQALQPHLTAILAALKDNYIYHEIGELHDTDFDRDIWREIIAAYPYSPVEYLARAVKDLLADTNEYGTLRHITAQRKTASVAFYAAFLDGLAKKLFPEILTSFQTFTRTQDWGVIEQAISSGYDNAQKHARLIIELYREGIRRGNEKWAETEIQKRLLGK